MRNPGSPFCNDTIAILELRYSSSKPLNQAVANGWKVHHATSWKTEFDFLRRQLMRLQERVDMGKAAINELFGPSFNILAGNIDVEMLPLFSAQIIRYENRK